MIKRIMTVDFSAKSGKMKPVSSVNVGPVTYAGLGADFTDEYKEMNIPAVRTHSSTYPTGLGSIVDLHSLFPDFSLDESLEESYSFSSSDAYFSSVRNAGCEIFLCIGETADTYFSRPDYIASLDPYKIARIAEHIIAHYNEGWASGFKLKIKYCEIFPDADKIWQSHSHTEAFYRLYTVIATHLKERFPKLKVGGYSSGGFYSLNHPLSSDEEKGRVDFLEGFLRYVSAKETAAPLDFFTWKCIADSPEELSLHANYARSYLSQFGFNKAESIVSEFNLVESKNAEAKLSRSYPSSLASSLIIAEKSNISAMFYSDLAPYSPTNAILTLDDSRVNRRYASFEVVRAFGELVSLKSALASSEDYRRELYLLAASDGELGGILLSTREYDGVLEISIRNAAFRRYSVRGIIGGAERGEGFVSEQSDIPLTDGRITLRTGKNEVYYIRLSK